MRGRDPTHAHYLLGLRLLLFVDRLANRVVWIKRVDRDGIGIIAGMRLAQIDVAFVMFLDH